MTSEVNRLADSTSVLYLSGPVGTTEIAAADTHPPTAEEGEYPSMLTLVTTVLTPE